jgi:hypothetical protein
LIDSLQGSEAVFDRHGNGVVPMKNNCAGMDAKLANLLLDPASAPAEVQTHVEGCAPCRRELDELRATMALLESWEAPEPRPYFLTRLDARLREERQAEPIGWLKGEILRLRARIIYGSGSDVRPLAAMALTVMLLVGGGTYLGITNWDQQPAGPQAAVVHDLQTMDSNAQLLDQLETISNNNENGD